ncbi:MAG: universal stress protein [Bacteroidota bacterium]
MKNILVPTDFSACATDATDAALALAELTNAHLHLYSRIDIAYNWATLSEKEKQQDRQSQQVIHNTERLFEEWAEKARERKVAFSATWSAGRLVENIEQYVEKYKIDFVVMGSHGASGKNEYFIGSNTQRVVRLVHCPVLIVKEPLEQYDFNRVVFASDFDEEEKEAFEYFLNFIRPFNPEIHLVSINKSGFFSQPFVLMNEAMKDFQQMAKGFTTHKHFYKDFSVDAGIRNFSEEIGADLIAISNTQRRPLKRMLAGSNVEALVNHAEAPVLTIDFALSVKEKQREARKAKRAEQAKSE